MKTALVLGAGGFIGSHMVKRLRSEGYWVRGVDLKYPEFSDSEANEFIIHDLTRQSIIQMCVQKNYMAPFEQPEYFDEVYQFAADMGGAGYIFTGEHDADVMHNSATINLNICEALKNTKSKVFYSSSACMYPKEKQNEHGSFKFDQLIGYTKIGVDLKESDAYPSNPDSEYGWEKLFSERLYLAYARNYGLNVRIARFHNIYGPEGTYKGGKEKAPAAMCRKVIESKPNLDNQEFCESQDRWFGPIHAIEIWGDGEQTRSFLYIDDCIDAVRLLMQSEFKEPINIGSEEMVTINQLANIAIELSGKDIKINHIDGPTGVRGRNSNNDLIRQVLNWEPKVKLSDGIERTYNWIKSQYGK